MTVIVLYCRESTVGCYPSNACWEKSLSNGKMGENNTHVTVKSDKFLLIHQMKTP